MAEGLARNLLGTSVNVESAGSHPGKVNPFAIEVMKEIGIDITGHHSKSIDELSPKFIVNLDFVVTLCAEEICPRMIAPKAKKLHWPFSDPATKDNLPNMEILERFRTTKEAISEAIKQFKSEYKL
jgi:arsenate reductase